MIFSASLSNKLHNYKPSYRFIAVGYSVVFVINPLTVERKEGYFNRGCTANHKTYSLGN